MTFCKKLFTIDGVPYECEREAGHDGPHRSLVTLWPAPSAESTPPETPYAKRRMRPESLLPPRAVPSAGLSAVLIGMATGIATTENPLPLWERAGAVVVLSLAAWFVGYFTPPPRRKFRKDD